MKRLNIVYSDEMEALHDQGWGLIEKGLLDEALDLWEQHYTQAGKLYPPALPDIVQLFIQMDHIPQAEIYLDLLEQVNEIEEGDWLVPILICRMMMALHQGDMTGTLHYVKKLEVLELDEEDRKLLEHLKESIGDASGKGFEQLINNAMMDEVMGMALQELLEDLSEKDLPLNPSLARGLKNLPVHWIDGTCDLMAIESLPKRKDREKQIISTLTDPLSFSDLCQEHLDDEEIEILKYILQNGGWCRFQVISRKFGGLDEESYFWPDEGTCTPVGNLWSLGLIMVGRADIKGRKTRIASIPVELREPLRLMVKGYK